VTQNDVIIRANGVEKHFAHIHAIRGVDMDLHRGEILALVGDNGAGKSTLASIIAGALVPDAGWVEIAGERIEHPTARLVHSLGVETLYQTLALAPDLTIAENVFLGREKTKTTAIGRLLHVLDRKHMAEQTKLGLERVTTGLPSAKVLARQLSGGQQQAIAVARAAIWARTAILMDEPTAALGARQTQSTNDVIRSAAADGLGVLVITHDIPNMLTFADRILVMRHGRIVATMPAAQTNVAELVELMVAAEEAA
jgi:simple sugar transport system ATP-binding protein